MTNGFGDYIQHRSRRTLDSLLLIRGCGFHLYAMPARIKCKQIGHLNGATFLFWYERNRLKYAFQLMEFPNIIKVKFSFSIVFMPAL